MNLASTQIHQRKRSKHLHLNSLTTTRRLWRNFVQLIYKWCQTFIKLHACCERKYPRRSALQWNVDLEIRENISQNLQRELQSSNSLPFPSTQEVSDFSERQVRAKSISNFPGSSNSEVKSSLKEAFEISTAQIKRNPCKRVRGVARFFHISRRETQSS